MQRWMPIAVPSIGAAGGSFDARSAVTGREVFSIARGISRAEELNDCVMQVSWFRNSLHPRRESVERNVWLNLQNEFDIRTAKNESGKEFDKIEPIQIQAA